MFKSFIYGLAVVALMGGITVPNSDTVKFKLGYSGDISYLLSSILNFKSHDYR